MTHSINTWLMLCVRYHYPLAFSTIAPMKKATMGTSAAGYKIFQTIKGTTTPYTSHIGFANKMMMPSMALQNKAI